jgi:hypothetical protein
LTRSTSRKAPKLSFEATHALNQASDPFFGIELAIERLDEPDLIAVAAEARRKALDGHHDLYLAVAALAEGELAKLAARRSAEGIWYACLDVIQWEPNQHVGKGIASFGERCDGRDAAVAKARELLIEHANRLSDDATVDARVVTELEWLADNAGRSGG